jgi:phospholipase/carboxylesterase
VQENDPYLIQDSGWVYRIPRSSDEINTRTCILIHGWTGDEHSMDIFLRAVPSDYAALSPRGPVNAAEGGYGWVDFRPGNLATFQNFEKTARELRMHIDRWIPQNYLPGGKLTIIGFSQGAAMALSFGLAFPERVERIGCLSGFLPVGTLPDPVSLPLLGINIFIAHGSKDDMIPISRAREAANWLRQAGAGVTSCESNVGHRLGANCFQALKSFLK